MYSDVLQTLFILMSFIITMNIMISAALIKYVPIAKSLMVYWSSLLIIFFLEGAFQVGELAIILVFSLNVIPMVVLKYFSDRIHKVKFNYWIFTIPYIFSLAYTLIFIDSSWTFTFKALPVTIVNCLPGLFIIFDNIKRWGRISIFDKLYSFATAFGIYALALFAIFRMVPGTQLWGWATGFSAYTILSVVTISCVVYEISKKEKVRLEKQVQERTSELKASKNKSDELLQILFHDIATPIMLVESGIKVGLSGSPEGFRAAQERACDISSLIRSLRNINDGEAGETIELNHIDVTHCVKHAIAMIRPKFSDKGVSLSFSAAEDFMAVGDKTSLIYHVALNILSNMYKFTPKGKNVNVEVSGNERFVICSFKDQGIGMSQQQIDHLFNFEKNNSTLGTNGEVGSGCGMPSMKTFIDIFGGEVKVQSSLEKGNSGTEFIVYLRKPSVPMLNSFSPV